jgi:hypothetical protein
MSGTLPEGHDVDRFPRHVSCPSVVHGGSYGIVNNGAVAGSGAQIIRRNPELCAWQ